MKTVLSAIQSIMKKASKEKCSPLGFIKTVYIGDPKKIPESNLPAITIAPNDTDFARRGSRYDQKTHEISVKIVLNMKVVLVGEDQEVVEAVIKVSEAMEGQNALHETKENTVCGVIQKNPCLAYECNRETIQPAEDAFVNSVNYGETATRAFPTYEAEAIISVKVVGDR